FRVDRVRSIERTGERVVRPPDFDLAEAWRSVTERMETQASVWARGLANPAILNPLRWTFGTRLHIGPPQEDGRVEFEVGEWNEHALVAQLAGFGADIDVHEPDWMRVRLAESGRAVVAADESSGG